ncbi:MAG: acyltransferase family protein [Bacteroidales bacterium]|nr:acyltransferase family protein [Bacteroidales bacterium]
MLQELDTYGTAVKRISYLDYSRVFVAFLVCYGHMESYGVVFPRMFIYGFHMPFFFMVSGILHKFNGRVQIGKYFRRLFVPFLFFNLISLCIVPLLQYLGIITLGNNLPGFNEAVGLFDTYKVYFVSTFQKFVHSRTMACGPMWFVLALFYCKVLADLWENNKIMISIVWLALFVFCCLCRRGWYFMIPQAVMAFPVYLFGAKARDMIHKIACSRFSLALAVICLAIFSLSVSFNGKATVAGVIFGSNHSSVISVPLFYINAFLGSLSVICLFSKLPSNRMVEVSACALLSILGFQNIILGVFRHFMGWDAMPAVIIVSSLVCMLFCVVLHRALCKICPALVGT